MDVDFILLTSFLVEGGIERIGGMVSNVSMWLVGVVVVMVSG
jgi:hypothetical protein